MRSIVTADGAISSGCLGGADAHSCIDADDRAATNPLASAFHPKVAATIFEPLLPLARSDLGVDSWVSLQEIGRGYSLIDLPCA
jgi:hypothetical protein